MKGLFVLTMAVGWMVTWVACIDEISLDLDSDQRFVIVDGQLADVPGEYEISLNLSPIIGVGNDNILDPISNADVRLLSSSNETVSFMESDTLPGHYFAFLSLSPGVTYHLEVGLDDGTVIQSVPQALPEDKLPIDGIDFDVLEVESINESGNVSIREFVELYVTTPPLADEGFVRWRVKGEYQFIEKYPFALNPRNCYIQDNVDFNNVKVAKTEDFANGEIVDFPILRTVFNDRFNIVYLFNVFQYSISRDEYIYWSNIQQLLNIDGTLFDPPPGAIKGNLRNITDPSVAVQGYVSIAKLSFERFFAVPTRKGYFIDTECTSNSRRPNPPKCADCTIVTRSSLIRPSYWVF